MQNDESKTPTPKAKALVEGYRRSRRSKLARVKARKQVKAKLKALLPPSTPQK